MRLLLHIKFKGESELRAVVWLRLRHRHIVDFAFKLRNNLLGNDKPETNAARIGSRIRILKESKKFEEFVLLFLDDSDSCIVDSNPQIPIHSYFLNFDLNQNTPCPREL